MEPDTLSASRDPDQWSHEYRELAGAIRSRYGYALLGRQRIPPILELHPGPSCPAGCRFCPTQGVKLYPAERRREPLSAEELRILVKDFAGLGGETLVLSGGLEPLTGPALAAASAAWEAGLEVHLYTSGLSALLDDPDERRVLLERVRRIRFSLNGMSTVTYGDVQLGGRPGSELLARLRRRIEALVRDRDDLGSMTSLGISFVVVDENASEVYDALDYCERLGLDFFDVLVDIGDDRAVPEGIGRVLQELRTRARRGQGRVSVRVSGRTGTAPARSSRCLAPRVKIAVDPFGFAWRCCHVANPEVSSPDLLLGDVRTQGLRAILHSKRAQPLETGCATCPDFERTFNALAEG